MLSVMRATLAPPSVIHNILLAVLSSSDKLIQSGEIKKKKIVTNIFEAICFKKKKRCRRDVLTFDEVSSAFGFRDIWLVGWDPLCGVK